MYVLGAVTLEISSSADLAFTGGVVVGTIVMVLLLSLSLVIILVIIKRCDFTIMIHDL